MTRTIDPTRPIFMILPYRLMDCWVFDDEAHGLYQEPFVGTTNEILDRMVAERKIRDSVRGFKLFFSRTPFDGIQYALFWVRESNGGNVYRSPEFELEGWLCPALFKYFQKAPAFFFVRVANR